MWMIDPRLMCAKHIRGEHSEVHGIVGMLTKAPTSPQLKGLIDAGLCELDNLGSRHEALVAESKVRGMPMGTEHGSPLIQPQVDKIGQVDREKSIKDLIERCPECKARIEARNMGII